MNFELNLNNKMKVRALLLAALCQLAAAASNSTSTDNAEIYDNLVIGIGRGTLAVIVFAIAGILLCLFRDCSSMPNLLVAAGICLPLLVLLIIVLLPKQSAKSDASTLAALPTDNYLLWKILITVGMGLVLVAMFAVTLVTRITVKIIAPRIESLDTADSKTDKPDIELQTVHVATDENKSLI
jgi:hypothetical protein